MKPPVATEIVRLTEENQDKINDIFLQTSKSMRHATHKFVDQQIDSTTEFLDNLIEKPNMIATLSAADALIAALYCLLHHISKEQWGNDTMEYLETMIQKVKEEK